MIHTITAYAFLRSQKPELKTDYRNFIESPECPPEVTAAFERVHEVLHRHFPKRPVRLSFPVETADGPYLCQCYCGEVPSPEGRHFLGLGGIAARVSELKHLDINPVALFVAADFTAVFSEEKAIIRRDVSAAPNFGVQADRLLRDEFAARLTGGLTGVVAWPEGANLHTVLCSLFYAYQDVPPERWYEAAFALELPPDADLPMPFAAVLAPQGATPHSPVESARITVVPAALPPTVTPVLPPAAVPPRPMTTRTGRQRLQALEKLADALRSQHGADDFWRYRLWHHCQDVVSAAEQCLEADDNRETTPASRHLALVKTRRERLEQEITRAFAAPDLRPVANDLKRDLQDWFENGFVPSLHVAGDGRGAPVARGDAEAEVVPRPRGFRLSRFPAWAWALLALAFFVVVAFLLLSQRAGRQ